MFPYLEVTTREGIGMKRIAIAVALLGSLGVACAKAEAETQMQQAEAQAPVVGLSDGVVKGAMDKKKMKKEKKLKCWYL